MNQVYAAPKPCRIHRSRSLNPPSTLVARASDRRIAEQRAGYDQALDLARALVDLGHLGVAVVALHGKVARVSVAAQDLDRLARLAARDGAGEQLGLGPLDRVRAAR